MDAERGNKQRQYWWGAVLWESGVYCLLCLAGDVEEAGSGEISGFDYGIRILQLPTVITLISRRVCFN